jgi:hypothetical protein
MEEPRIRLDYPSLCNDPGDFSAVHLHDLAVAGDWPGIS